MRRRTLPNPLRCRAGRGVTGVLHCFTGSADLARKGLDLGFLISLSGIVTFKNARDLQDTARFIPAIAYWLRPMRRSSRRCRTAEGVRARVRG
jgi:hypothetical protein